MRLLGQFRYKIVRFAVFLWIKSFHYECKNGMQNNLVDIFSCDAHMAKLYGEFETELQL